MYASVLAQQLSIRVRYVRYWSCATFCPSLFSLLPRLFHQRIQLVQPTYHSSVFQNAFKILPHLVTEPLSEGLVKDFHRTWNRVTRCWKAGRKVW